ncbi:hypothetical protein H0H81_000480 [Sphagnurus paluster]|uniref:Heme peroxidase n=1 Tax=Sphagnurus paluster TaxID=117069 RepID=A0A9P7G064_9AGAR|nr:hypothetical protein H0H81_000480 [Sphagnurus paluster]
MAYFTTSCSQESNSSESAEKISPATTAPQTIRDFRDNASSPSKDTFKDSDNITTIQVKKGNAINLNLSTLLSLLDGIRHKESIDDRKFLLEHALTFVSRLNEGPLATTIQNKIVELLYNDLGHPPATSIGNAYAWRTADGSHNNIDLPNMGKAGTPYARSVQQTHPVPKNQLPDPGLIFDTVFRTSHRDVNINETSSYVDLSPLYGHNQEAQNQVRVRDGYGLLKPDVFAEDRLLLLPPAVCAILVLFNRNHNYIARKLLAINERGTYVDPSTLRTDIPAQKNKLLAQEEELFQIARLINCGWFASVVFSDYFSCILGLVRDGSSWSLNPFGEIRNDDHSVFERDLADLSDSFYLSSAYKTFSEWNTDKEVADAAEKLYGHIDHLELYVGLQAEEAKPVMEGAGLCPGFTISRAILSDAIALTRGDRFFTQDYTPFNLTAWGFADCQRDPNAFGFGSTLGRLLLRTLPDHYTENSIYTFFPLMTPDAMKPHLKKLNVIDQYDLWRPVAKTVIKTVNAYPQVAAILKDSDTFSSPYAARAARVIQGKGFYAVDGADAQEKVYKALGDTPDSINKIGRFFYEKTRELIDARSFSLVGKKTNGVDLVREVLKYVPVYWAASDIAGFSLKTKDYPHGHYTPEELYRILGDIYSFVFLDIEASKVMVLGAKVTTHVKTLLGHIKAHLGQGLVSRTKKVEHNALVKRLSAIGGSPDELATTILALMVGSTVEISLAITNTINLYLSSEQEAELRGLAKADDVKNSLDGFVYEALRLDPPLQGVYRTATKDHNVEGLVVQKGDRIFLDVAQANQNQSVFSEAKAVNVKRGPNNILHGDGAFSHLGEQLTVKIIAEVLRAVFQYENVRRAPGQSGTLKRYKDHSRPELGYAYLDHEQFSSAWPTSLTILYDTPQANGT